MALELILAETSHWIAMISPGDRHHAQALALAREISEDRIVTSELILAELLDHFSSRGSYWRQRVAQDVLHLRHSRVRIMPFAGVPFESAVELYRQRPDKAWSLTDCAAMRLMDELGIAAALTTDHHFEQAGFRILLV